jgi:hypothetical protein
MTKLIVAFRNFANVPKNENCCCLKWSAECRKEGHTIHDLWWGQIFLEPLRYSVGWNITVNIEIVLMYLLSVTINIILFYMPILEWAWDKSCYRVWDIISISNTTEYWAVWGSHNSAAEDSNSTVSRRRIKLPSSSWLRGLWFFFLWRWM